MFGIDGGISNRRNPVPLHREDIRSPREFLNHAEDEGHCEKDLFRGRIAEGQDDEPYYTREQNADAVNEDSCDKYSEAGWSAVDPAA